MDLKKNYDLIHLYTSETEFFRRLYSYTKAGLRREWEGKRKKLFEDKIDVAAFGEDFADRSMGWKKESGLTERGVASAVGKTLASRHMRCYRRGQEP